jgi:hypothetical protein
MVTTSVFLTTLNYRILRCRAISSESSLAEIVRMLLWRAVKRSGRRFAPLERLRHQKRSARKNGRVVHISLPPELYEMCMDLRKLFKCSVSLILAEEIEKYFNDLSSDEKMDKYGRTYVIFYRNDISGNHYQVFTSMERIKQALTP